MNDLGKKKLLSILEGAFHNHIENNIGEKIRYPIRFDDNKEIRGRAILKVTDESIDVFYSGRYTFGANKLFIYQAIDSLLEKLEELEVLDTFALKELIEEYQEEDE